MFRFNEDCFRELAISLRPWAPHSIARLRLHGKVFLGARALGMLGGLEVVNAQVQSSSALGVPIRQFAKASVSPVR